ncbi:tRNA (adenosine(37)-N6)-dimethylallyltransferase MiaA [bacterium]|nr:tRNA (adenosine(37)-N6)-dimethylallyltransferase MiaA [bacterium]
MAAKIKLIVILGPTASGKSSLAVELAREFGGEVVSADSRQVYKGLDIGTGKITKREMQGVPHHLIDIALPKRQLSVSEYKKRADKTIEDIARRGKVPILCGGTGFYIDAVAEGIVFPEVLPNPLLRKKLAEKKPDELFVMLQKLDPRRAKTIEKNNPRRLIRAIEIARALGNVPELKKSAPKYNALYIGIAPDTETLCNNIHARLLARMKKGMIAEAKRLHEQGLSWKRMEELGLEYRYLSRHLRGMLAKEEMQEKLETEIQRYAKRQMVWFKRNKKIKWFKPNEAAEIKKETGSFLEKLSTPHIPLQTRLLYT